MEYNLTVLIQLAILYIYIYIFFYIYIYIYYTHSTLLTALANEMFYQFVLV